MNPISDPLFIATPNPYSPTPPTIPTPEPYYQSLLLFLLMNLTPNTSFYSYSQTLLPNPSYYSYSWTLLPTPPTIPTPKPYSPILPNIPTPEPYSQTILQFLLLNPISNPF